MVGLTCRALIIRVASRAPFTGQQSLSSCDMFAIVARREESQAALQRLERLYALMFCIPSRPNSAHVSIIAPLAIRRQTNLKRSCTAAGFIIVSVEQSTS